MFDRKAFKTIAKKQLQHRWSTPVLATLVLLFVLAILSVPSLKEFFRNSNVPRIVFNEGTDFSSFFVGFTAVNRSSLFLTIVGITIIGIVNIAYSYLFLVLGHTREPVHFGAFLQGFLLWVRGALGMLWTMLWVTLWSVLFFIPGIVKAYAYSFTPFILAEHPNVSVRKAMRLSIEITRGYKGDLFMMDMSFILWFMLCTMTGGILFLYVSPYLTMSRANAYEMLKAIALSSKRISEADLGEGNLIKEYINKETEGDNL